VSTVDDPQWTTCHSACQSTGVAGCHGCHACHRRRPTYPHLDATHVKRVFDMLCLFCARVVGTCRRWAFLLPCEVCGSASSAAIDPGVVGWWAWGVGGSAAFVGRDRELARLRAVVGGGEARLLLVVGDAGVGKTGLVTEAMWRVAADGAVVVWGGCLPMRRDAAAAAHGGCPQ
jgi:hypothetical protein